MGAVRRLPARRDVFLDQRGPDRGLRVTTHPDQGVVVLSIWHGERCAATFRLPVEDSARLIAVLAGGLADQLAEHRADAPVRQSDAAADS